MGERGLKPPLSSRSPPQVPVAPYGGAWIETFLPPLLYLLALSLPMGERGLKRPSVPPHHGQSCRSLWGSVD